ncbi:hypothetical protein Dip510_000593 [Elusimicrobium posterum]|uniref:hypothetical protein n=1 Tax=Elusimicrobium posterum TaxID=3116653 RepID=UPI003C783E4D
MKKIFNFVVFILISVCALGQGRISPEWQSIEHAFRDTNKNIEEMKLKAREKIPALSEEEVLSLKLSSLLNNVFELADSNGRCHSFRIHKNWLLTAAHCVEINKNGILNYDIEARNPKGSNYKRYVSDKDFKFTFLSAGKNTAKVYFIGGAKPTHTYNLYKEGDKTTWDDTRDIALIYLATPSEESPAALKEFFAFPLSSFNILSNIFENQDKTPFNIIRGKTLDFYSLFHDTQRYQAYSVNEIYYHAKYASTAKDVSGAYYETKELILDGGEGLIKIRGKAEKGFSGSAAIYKDTITGVLRGTDYSSVYILPFRQDVKEFMRESFEAEGMLKDFEALKFVEKLD